MTLATALENPSGVRTGFDRLVFRGALRRLNCGWWHQTLNAVEAEGIQPYLWQNEIVFKDHERHVSE